MILIITNKCDSHADAVIRVLRESQKGVFRLNTEDLLSKYSVGLHINERGEWRGVVEDELGRVLHLEELRSGWIRKPSYKLTGQELSNVAADYVLSELKSLMDVFYSLPNIVWVNDPFCANRARVKFQQLVLAKQLGVKTPRTIITSNPKAARHFVIACGGDVLIKSIYTSNVTIDGMNRGILSKRISISEFEEFSDTIHLCPTLIQEYCEKQFELRVTIIGASIFAVKLESQKNIETKVDWRSNTYLNPHDTFELPEDIRQFCLSFMREQRLIYGAMDFIVTPGNDYVFLENNPFGNYQWLEEATNIDLTGELARLLSVPEKS